MNTIIKNTSELALDICPNLIRPCFRLYGAITSSFKLPNLWSLLYFDYEADIELDDIKVRVKPGYVALVPPGVKKVYYFEGMSPHYAIHFQEDIDATKDDVEISLMPWLIDTEEHWVWFLDAVKEMLEYWDECPGRAQMRLWDMLFRIADAPPFSPHEKNRMHSAVKAVKKIVELGMDDKLSVKMLAEKVELSPSHLTVLFRQHLGISVQQYIKKQRVDHARYLLVNTDMAIKEIAVETGMADLQYFNKSIHKAFGMSPRAFRKSNSV